jgi:hypothetical protein
MAVVPNAWGLWNIAFVASREKLHTPIGLHGMLLPFVLAPLAIVVISLLDIPRNLIFHALPVGILLALVIYYLAWKYLVGGLNAVLGIA